MAEESSDQKAVFTSIKDSFFDDPFFKVRIRIIKWQNLYTMPVAKSFLSMTKFLKKN